jgi:hypothetical protein
MKRLQLLRTSKWRRKRDSLHKRDRLASVCVVASCHTSYVTRICALGSNRSVASKPKMRMRVRYAQHTHRVQHTQHATHAARATQAYYRELVGVRSLVRGLLVACSTAARNTCEGKWPPSTARVRCVAPSRNPVFPIVDSEFTLCASPGISVTPSRACESVCHITCLPAFQLTDVAQSKPSSPRARANALLFLGKVKHCAQASPRHWSLLYIKNK